MPKGFLATLHELFKELESDEVDLAAKLHQANGALAKLPIELGDVHERLHTLVMPHFKDLTSIVPNQVAYAKCIMLILKLAPDTDKILSELRAAGLSN